MVLLYEHSSFSHWRNIHLFLGHSRTLRSSVRGEFYDEVIPASKDMLGDETCKLSVPRSCKYLLLAYHHLPKDSDGVLISAWIGFWFKGSLRYATPPLRSFWKRVHEPKFSRNPSGDIDASNLPPTKTMTSLSLYRRSLLTYETRFIRPHFSHVGYATLSSYIAKLARCVLLLLKLQGSLKKEILTCILKELGRLLQSSTLSSTSYKLLIPDNVSTSPLITKEYAHLWAKRNKTSLEKTTRVVLKLNHLSNLEKGSKDNQVILVIETEVAKSIAATSNRRHNMLVDAPITTLSSENDIISALSISNGQLSNPQSLQKLTGLEERVPVTPKGSIGSVNGISEFDLPKAEAVLNGDLQPASKDDHLSIETPSKCPKIALPAILKKSPLVEDVWEKSKKTLEALFWPSSSAEVIDFYP
ncbi:UNVERIFIED_CONTAM: hypothetical protein Sangu_1865000 [Sesamum angustifolium]|uniref:Uncharacterized protein n=1 Tax=Sesamum angustifolium TaxID=2727405 RepID=A0AAW2LSY8_9LAMI